MPRNSDLLDRSILDAADLVQRLEPGSLAELRRMGSSGASAFWYLSAKHPNTVGLPQDQATWMEIVQTFSLLVPKGDPSIRPELHSPRRSLGAVLCDGGDAVAWKSESGPVFSVHRLNRLVAARERQRAMLLQRAVRSLPSGTEVNVFDVAYVLLEPENGGLLAEPYYRRLEAEQVERTSNRPAPDRNKGSTPYVKVCDTVLAAEEMMRDPRYLDAGSLAELRRMDVTSAAPAFWRLKALLPEMARGLGGENLRRWVTIIRTIAALVPRGTAEGRKSLHNAGRPLGAVLCDGGEADWRGPSPVFSEHRLMQLLAAKGTQRQVLLERAVRVLPPGTEVKVPDIAFALLKPDDGNLLASSYYDRLDQAESESKRSQKGSK